jgi:hypothetical protein
VFCPYGSKGDWQVLRCELPETFAKIVELEARKPPTKKNGLKLSIMGYSSRTKNLMAAQGLKYVPPTLDEWTMTSYRRTKEPCAVCGAAERATKATGCGYLEAA